MRQAVRNSSSGARVTLRVTFGPHAALGPGKVRLIELIAELGSIAAAAKAMGMSYKRAWSLVGALNASFRRPVIVMQHGGARGGGAVVTDTGHEIVRRYRRIEKRVEVEGKSSLQALAALVAAPSSLEDNRPERAPDPRSPS